MFLFSSIDGLKNAFHKLLVELLLTFFSKKNPN